MTLNKELLINMAKKYGTPLYVYDGDLILKRYKELYDFIKWPKLKIFYAMKANYNFSILKLLKENDAYIDTVSPAEVMLALKAGFSKDKLLYTANNMTEEDVKIVKDLGVIFNIGSLSRLEKFGKAYPGSGICLRFNPDVVAGMHRHMRTGGDLTKFGILLNEVDKALELVKKYDLKVIGLHEHTGSGIADMDKMILAINNLLNLITKDNFPDLKFLNFGGGLKVPYKEDEERVDYALAGEKVVKIFSDFCKKYGKELELYLEPGRYIVAESGFLIIEVNTLKNNKGRLIAGTNSGFSQLIRPVLYDVYHSIENLTNPDGAKDKYDICGNICETGDCFAWRRDLPEIREGDLLAIKNAGAYCYSMGSVYNLRAMPSEILILNGKDKLIRKELTNEELVDQLINESSEK